jgi:uncharacterized protein YkwD
VFAVFTTKAFAEFDWGTGCEGGSGTFQQYIQSWNEDPENAVTVGTIPAGMKNVYIGLNSDKDVDIRIYDADGTPVVHWPHGILSAPSTQSATYNGVMIRYSGYNGDGTLAGLGHEYIEVTGTTQNAFIMKAFGYQAGYATVDYSWDANENNCGPAESGGGSFQQQILQNDIIKVGDIPPGVSNLYIQLTSDEDVDIQLYDKDNGTAIIKWAYYVNEAGILNGANQQSTNYQGMTIEWSGYNGDGTGLGNEYIKITGTTTRNLTMMAYGYQSGYAVVDYSWGKDTQSNANGSTNSTGQGYTEILELINQARSVSRQCGYKGYFEATSPVTWNEKLYEAALQHSKNMANLNFFDHTGLDGSNPGDRIKAQGYDWWTYMENIAAGQNTASEAIAGWLESPGHCANIMNTDITEIGLAYAENTSSSYGIYWTLNGAAPK